MRNHLGDFDPARHPRAAGGSARGRQTQASRVRDLVDAALKDGFYSMDEPLIEETLMETLGASRSAVRQGLRLLADQGMLSRKRRAGTLPVQTGVRVALDDICYLDPADPDRRIEVTIRVTDQRLVPTSPLLAAVLDTDDHTVQLTENVYLHEDTVFGIRTAYYRRGTYVDPRPRLNADMPRIGREVFQLSIFHVASTEIGTAEVDLKTARVLGVEGGSRVLTRRQVFVDALHRPVQVVFDQYRADMVTFVSSNRPIRRGLAFDELGGAVS